MAKAAAEHTESNGSKNGLMTTEFWLSLAPIVVAIGDFTRTPPADVNDAIVRVAAILGISAVVVSYNVTRGRIKSAGNEAKAAVASAKGA